MYYVCMLARVATQLLGTAVVDLLGVRRLVRIQQLCTCMHILEYIFECVEDRQLQARERGAAVVQLPGALGRCILSRGFRQGKTAKPPTLLGPRNRVRYAARAIAVKLCY